MEQKYNVFISYRRDGGEFTAKTIHDKLHDLGYQVFLDVESLRSGLFNLKLYSVIDECTDVVIILSPGALDRCKNEDDWVRREIEYALQKRKNVIPIILRGFIFPEKLPENMNTLPYMQGLQANLEYFDAFIQKLQSFLLSEPYHRNPVFSKKNLTIFFPAALAMIAVTIGIVFLLNNRTHTDQTSSPNPNPESSQTALMSGGSDLGNSSTNKTSEPNENDDIRWQSNTLMAGRDVEQDTGVLSLDIARDEIHSITFLDSLDNMPEDAWDVSAKRNKKVMAWTIPRDSGYDLYIGGEGGVAANENSSHLFESYTNLEWIQINGNFHTENVRNMAYMFHACESLTLLDVSNFNTSNVTDMCRMFSDCKSLTLLDVSNFDTSNVTDMYEMFFLCESMTQLYVSNFDTSNVTDMRNMFGWCKSLTQLDVSNFDTSNVTNMSGMFGSCLSLTQLDVSNFDTSNVTDMSDMFDGCESLTLLDVSNFITSNVTGMSGMFAYCESLTQLDVSNFITSNVTGMGGMFAYCENLTQLDVSNFNTSNVTAMYDMFYHCESLTQLDVSNFDTSNVTDMNGMFGFCSSLTQLDVSNFDTSNVIEVSNMFKGCDNLARPDVSNFAPELVEKMGLSK